MNFKRYTCNRLQWLHCCGTRTVTWINIDSTSMTFFWHSLQCDTNMEIMKKQILSLYLKFTHLMSHPHLPWEIKWWYYQVLFSHWLAVKHYEDAISSCLLNEWRMPPFSNITEIKLLLWWWCLHHNLNMIHSIVSYSMHRFVTKCISPKQMKVYRKNQDQNEYLSLVCIAS